MSTRDQRPDPRIWPDEPPTARITNAITKTARAIRAATRQLGTPHTVTVDGVRYRLISGPPLEDLISGRATGHAEYLITFPDGQDARIAASADRILHDVLTDPATDPLLWLAPVIDEFVRPGDRALILGAGTGALADHTARCVGPSGAVTAIEADPTSAYFARRRYPNSNTAVETGDHAALDGEPDACAEAVIISPLAAAFPTDHAWRLVAPGGTLIAAAHHAPDPAWLKTVGVNPPPAPRSADRNANPDRRVAVVRRDHAA